MNTLCKKILVHIFLVIPITIIYLTLSWDIADAKYVKKIIIEPFSDPVGWDKTFKPGAFISTMLENNISDSGGFQLVQDKMKGRDILIKTKVDEGKKQQDPSTESEEKQNTQNSNQARINKLTNPPLGQYKVRGNILLFNPDINPLRKGFSKKEARFHKERATVKASIELVNLHTGRLLAKKIFTANSNSGSKTFNLSSENNMHKTSDLKYFSSGLAMIKLEGQVQEFVYKILDKLPLEGDLIAVNQVNNSATINLGKTNGIRVRDMFNVYSVQTSFEDPVDNVDLGDMYIRKGVLKINEVQGRFSKAKILVGQGLSPGDLVVPKINGSKRLKAAENQSWMRGVIWGDYKGLPSLSE